VSTTNHAFLKMFQLVLESAIQLVRRLKNKKNMFQLTMMQPQLP
jgi:hypothetical protein